MWKDIVTLGILQHEDFSDSRLWAAWYAMYPEAWKTKGKPRGIGWL